MIRLPGAIACRVPAGTDQKRKLASHLCETGNDRRVRNPHANRLQRKFVANVNSLRGKRDLVVALRRLPSSVGVMPPVIQRLPLAMVDGADVRPPTAVARPASGSREAFYQTVLESLAEGVIITDAENRIFYANGVASEITGYPPEELLGADARQVLFNGNRREVDEADEECPNCAEVELRRKDGELGWVYLRTTPYRNESGETAGTITAISCIHKRKCLEFENEALQEEIRENVGSIIGDSLALRKVVSQIRTVAPTEASVLVLGESGTGKELV